MNHSERNHSKRFLQTMQTLTDKFHDIVDEIFVVRILRETCRVFSSVSITNNTLYFV